MALRKFPYGYEMKNGEIAVRTDEAEVVTFIFKARADGRSNWDIAKELYESNYEYFSDSVKKNSCKISAIIYDSRYIGTDGYPPVVDIDLFNRVQKLKGKAYCDKANKATRTTKNTSLKETSTYDEFKTTMFIPDMAVFNLEEKFRQLLKEGDAERIRETVFELAAEKYRCIT